MEFNIWFTYDHEIKKDDDTTETKTTRRNLKNIDRENLATEVNNMIKSIPDNATHVWLEVSKKYDEDQLMADVKNY